MPIRIFLVVQNFVNTEEPRQCSKVRLDSRFEITQHVMFSVVFPVNLVVRIARIFAQNQFNRPIGRLVTLPLAHHARGGASRTGGGRCRRDRKSTRLNSSHMSISYAVFCLKKKKKPHFTRYTNHITNKKL